MLNYDDLLIERFDPYEGVKGMKVVDVASGVKVTHIPTGKTVVVNVEKSQLRNKGIALKQMKNLLGYE